MGVGLFLPPAPHVTCACRQQSELKGQTHACAAHALHSRTVSDPHAHGAVTNLPL